MTDELENPLEPVAPLESEGLTPVDGSEESEEEQATVDQTQLPVDANQLQRVVEGALLAGGQPLSTDKLLALFDEEVAPSKEQLIEALHAVQANCEGRGFELKEVASGWRFQVCADTAPWVNRLWEEKPQKYSRALLETLSLIAYRQPITRGDIEEIRGVAVSSHIIKTLTEREWVKVVGHRDVPGRPSLFATTRQFLDYFNLKSLEDLPSLGEIQDLDQLNAELAFGEANPPVAQESQSTDAAEAATETGQAVTQQASDSGPIADLDSSIEDSEQPEAVAESSGANDASAQDGGLDGADDSGTPHV